MATGLENLKTRALDCYPLSSMQENMLAQSRYVEHPGLDIEQVVGDLREPLDLEAFQAAWKKVVQRHNILRTGFRWDELSRPLQQVHPSVPLQFEKREWSGSEKELNRRFAEWMREDRRHGFDLSSPPLMRVAIFDFGDESYRFVWTFHHLLLDATGFRIILEEVFAFYEATRAGFELELAPPQPYRQFIHWLEEQDFAQSEQFWRKQLQGFTEQTPLVIARNVPSALEGEETHGEQTIRLNQAETTALELLARNYGVRLSTLVEGTWGLLLAKYSGRQDVVFGAVRSGRRTAFPGAESLVGLLINTVPLRVKCEGDWPVFEWLRHVREQQLAVRNHQHTPLLSVLGWTDLPSSTPLFQSLINFQSTPWHELLRSRGPEWEGRDFSIRNQPGYPLWVDSHGGPELTLKIGYDRSRFEDDSICRMLQHYKMLLSSIAANPTLKLREISLLSPSERHRVLVEWNKTEAEFPQNQCVQDLFEIQASRTPDALAVGDASAHLSFSELNIKANQLAHYLQSVGVGPESVVAICVERSVDMVVAQLATLKAGAAYLPLDPAYPSERLVFMLKDSQALLLITRQGLDPQVEIPKLERLFLDVPAHASRITHHPSHNPVRQTTSTNLAYIIYTSGSTGQPKGVAVEHRGLMNLVTWHQNAYEVTPQDRATQLASPAFDAAVWELWPYLTAGASVHIPDEQTRLSPEKLICWLRDQKITLAFMPTPLAEAFMEQPWLDGLELRALLTGGDKLHRPPPPTLRCWLTNHYGPTENTVVTTAAVIEAESSAEGPPPIGCPIANTRTYILDSDLEPVPICLPGELYVSGVGLSRGYLNQPELTRERFIANPFSNGDVKFQRLYRTGDRARYLPDGNIEFLGRTDQQIKIRGHRIELGEIEAILGQHPMVLETVVTAPEVKPGQNALVAYIVVKQGNKAVQKPLRDFLKHKLPDYMVPSTFVFLKAIPLTRNGKVDRAALPAPEPYAEDDQEFVPPRNETERLVAQAWCDVLGRERVGATDNFFELGGHSLQATQVINRLRNVFKADIPLLVLFETPTVEGLTAKLNGSAQRGESNGRAGKTLVENLVEESTKVATKTPISFGQERIWFLEQLEPGIPMHNIPVAFELTGPLNIQALERSLTEIVRRHKPLRTTFTAAGGRPVASEQPVGPITIPVVDLGSIPAQQQVIEARRLADAEASKPFDLSVSPLLRATVLRLGPESHWLLLTMHHIASDGWSFGIFNRELSALYEAFSQCKPSPLPNLPIEYAHFACSQRRALEENELGGDIAFWREQLRAPLAVLDLPTDRQRPARQTFRGGMVPVELPSGLTESVHALARREKATMFMLLVSAFQALLQRYSGQQDIVVGSPIAGRNPAETEQLIGLFLNTLVLRSDFSGDPTFSELLARVRELALGAYQHQSLPFEKLVEALAPERDLSRSPLFQAMFVLQNEPLPGLELRGLNLRSLPAHSGTAKFDLTFSLEETNGKLSGYIEYNSDLFDESTVTRFLAHYRMLLESVLDNPAQRLSELTLLSVPERRQLLVEWNNTKVELPKDQCIHHFFEQQAARTPEKIAVVFENEQLTFNELNQRADALAAQLQALGVGPDIPVGICVSRSLEMMVGLLGILKAGGCYLPLDPTYPADRLAFMLEDSGAPVLLTQQALLPKLNLTAREVLYLDAPQSVPHASRVTHHASRPTSDNLAYVIYTSGSTGRPKGVMITHRNVMNFFIGMDRLIGTEPGVWLAVTSISFDISVLELFWTLGRGFKVVLQAEADHRKAEVMRQDGSGNGQRSSVPEQILRHRVTHLQCTPSLVGTLVLTSESVQAMRSLSKILLGGEALLLALARKVRATFKAELFNMYGPTETTVWSSAHRVDEIAETVPIGKPIANTQMYVLDPHLQPVPLGVAGELFIGGEGVARGYLNRPELTAEKFIANPFERNSNDRLYRTGDRARLRPDGNIEFLGRVDQQVKLRGQRIELGEIESVLREFPGVTQCAVRMWENGPEDQRLAAYVVFETKAAADSSIGVRPSSGAATTMRTRPVNHADLSNISNVAAPEDGRTPLAEIRRFAQSKLPAAMVPAAFVKLDQLPMTPNGKVDRKALPAPDIEQTRPATEYVAPRTDIEKTIASIWSELLRVGQTGLHDNFFDLGGHSLLVVQAQARLRDALGIDLPVVKLFQYPTVSSLAAFLSQRQQAAGTLGERGRRKQSAYARRSKPEHELVA